MKLVIVESPKKSETIWRYLGPGYNVLASEGHIRDLSTRGKGGLGINIEANFKPDWTIPEKKRGVVADSPVVDIPMAKLPQVLPVFVREKGMDQVLDSPFDETDFTEVRNRLMVAMFYETGIRRAELISLKN